MGRLDFLYRMELPHRAVAVYLYLYDRANRDGECWPSIPTIARELKLSESTVRRAIQDLKKAELLVTEQRYRASRLLSHEGQAETVLQMGHPV